MRRDAHREHCPGKCRVASSMEQEQHRTMGTAAVKSKNVQRSEGNWADFVNAA